MALYFHYRSDAYTCSAFGVALEKTVAHNQHTTFFVFKLSADAARMGDFELFSVTLAQIYPLSSWLVFFTSLVYIL